MEAADWVIFRLTGQKTRSECALGYKALYRKGAGFPDSGYFRALDQRLERVVEEKLGGEILPLGAKAGEITPEAARLTGLLPGTAVAVANVDAHVSVSYTHLDVYKRQDLTKEMVAQELGLDMQLHQPSMRALEGYFERFGRVMTENNKKQAYFPVGAHVLPNRKGTAPGLSLIHIWPRPTARQKSWPIRSVPTHTWTGRISTYSCPAASWPAQASKR